MAQSIDMVLFFYHIHYSESNHLKLFLKHPSKIGVYPHTVRHLKKKFLVSECCVKCLAQYAVLEYSFKSSLSITLGKTELNVSGKMEHNHQELRRLQWRRKDWPCIPRNEIAKPYRHSCVQSKAKILLNPSTTKRPWPPLSLVHWSSLLSLC